MLVQLKVSVQDLVHGLLAANIDNVVSFGQLVKNSDFTGLLRKSTNAERTVTPPRGLEASWVPVGVWHQWWDVKVSTHGAIVPEHIGLRVHCHLWLLGVLIEPVRDVLSCCLDHWLGSFKIDVSLDQLS